MLSCASHDAGTSDMCRHSQSYRFWLTISMNTKGLWIVSKSIRYTSPSRLGLTGKRMNDRNNPAATRGWDSYWQGTGDRDSYSSDGQGHPALTTFWADIFEQALRRRHAPRIVDIASGSGAVIGILTQHTADLDAEISCVDVSQAAVDSVCTRYPAVAGIVADAASIPLESSHYDLVTSQFGIEYAGPDAMDEAARLIAKGGTLAALIHVRPGMIFDECRTARDAVRRMQKCEFFSLALRFFEAGFAAVRGGDRRPYDRAASKLNPAIAELTSILADAGQDVAGGRIARLYADVERMHRRIQYHEPNEVIGWLRAMDHEFDEYRSRMASMCDAAVDKNGYSRILERLRERGLTIVRGDALLQSDDSRPLAWALHAMRDA